MSLPLKLLTHDELIAVAQSYRNELSELRADVERLRGIIEGLHCQRTLSHVRFVDGHAVNVEPTCDTCQVCKAKRQAKG